MSKLYPKLQIGGNTPSRQGNTIDDYVFNPLIKKAEEAKNWAIKKATPVVSNIVAKMLPSTTPQFIRNHIYNSYDTVKYPDIATAFSQYGFGNRDLKKHEIEKGVVHVGEEAWKKFLDLPQDSKWIQPSPDKPDSSVNKSSKFYQLSPQVVDSNYVVNYARSQNKPVGTIVGMNGLSPFVPKSHMSEENFNAIDPLQHFNMEYGKDTKGRYVAIHDKYDFDNKVVDKIGKPFEFYKRYHYQQGGTLSQLGYKRHSPYNQASSLLIDTPTGSITMKEVDHPILGIGKGEIQIMHPEKEYQFKSNKVLEIPMRSVYPKAQMGTKLPSDNTRVVRNYELPQKFNKQGLRTNLVGKRTGNEIKKDFGKTGTGEIEASVSPLDIAQIGYMGAKVITKAPSLIKSLSKTSQKSSLDWGKWNSEIPFNKPLIKEYSQIEKATKKSGTWMKNPDGSDFEGLPEQFVQQQSSNFKKSFSNPILDEKKNIQISYHGSPNSFDKFDENLSRVGKYGKGVYTTPNKNIAKQYTNKDLYGNKTDNVLELYINSRNPQNLVRNEHIADLDKSFQVLKSKYKGITTSSNPDFKKEFDELMKKQDDLYDNMPESHWYLEDSHDFIRVGDEQVTPYTNLLKSAKNNNGMFDMSNPNIYKAVVPVIISGKVLSDYKNNQMKTTLYPKKFQQGGVAPEMSPEQQQEIVRRVRNLRKKLPKMGVAYDPISFRHAMYVNKKAFDQQDQELLGAFDEEMMVKLMNEIPDDDQPTYKKGGSIKGKSKIYPKCKCGCGGVSVKGGMKFQQGGTMDVLDEDGNSQMKIVGGERIFSRVATKKMLELNESKNYAELGKYICDELKAQDEREPQYVKE